MSEIAILKLLKLGFPVCVLPAWSEILETGFVVFHYPLIKAHYEARSPSSLELSDHLYINE